MTTPPAPLEWHPAYRHQTWLLGWIEGRTDYPADHLVLPVPQRPATLTVGPDDLYPTRAMRQLVLTRHKAWGPAPYVGRPFFYAWWVATDELGRSIAGESRIVYTDHL